MNVLKLICILMFIFKFGNYNNKRRLMYKFNKEFIFGQKVFFFQRFWSIKRKDESFTKFLAKEIQSTKQLVLNFMDSSVTRVIKLFNTFSSYTLNDESDESFFFWEGNKSSIICKFYFSTFNTTKFIHFAAYTSSLIFWIIKRSID